MKRTLSIIGVLLVMASAAMAYAFLDFSQVLSFFGFGDDVVLLEETDGTVLWEGKTIPPASGYVQDGLIAMWDGIENAGPRRHSATATTWVDLAGSRDLTLAGGAGFSSSALSIPDSVSWGCAYRSGVFTNYVHSEVVFKLTSANSDNVEELFHSGVPTMRYMMIYTTTASNTRFGFGSFWSGGYNGAASLNISKANFLGVPHVVAVTYGTGANGNPCATQVLLDGTSASINNSTSTGGGSAYTCIGNLFNNRAQRPWHGDIMCLRFYNRALTDAEIAYNYTLDKERFGLE